MNFFKRATASITRKPGKTGVLLALVFILGNVIAGAITISQSVINTKDAVFAGVTTIVQFDTDHQKILEAHPELAEMEENLDYSQEDYWESEEFKAYHKYQNEVWGKYRMTPERIEAVGALPMVDYYDYTTNAHLESYDLKRVIPESQKRFQFDRGGWAEYFGLHGSQNKDPFELRMNVIEIVDGNAITDEQFANGETVVLVSKEWAEQNDLSVGSTFELISELRDWSSSGKSRSVQDDDSEQEEVELDEFGRPPVLKTLKYEFTIVGLYDLVEKYDPEKDKHGEKEWQVVEQLSRIYSTNAAINKIARSLFEEQLAIVPEWFQDNAEFEDHQHYNPMFVLTDSSEVRAFAEAVRGMYGDMFSFANNLGDSAAITAPLDSMSELANIILIVGVGAALIILSLLITLFLRDRRNEIGIYLALGERRGRIVNQILTEVMAVALVGITLSLFSGYALSGIVSEQMIDNQIMAQQTAGSGEDDGFKQDIMIGGYNPHGALDMYKANISLEDLKDRYQVSLGWEIALLFYAGGVATVLVSVLFPIIYIIRLNPRKILM